MTYQLAGKTALVMGASQGIGAAVAEVFAAEGMTVFLVARRSEALSAYASHLTDRFGNVNHPIVSDVSTKVGIAHLLTEYLSLAKGQPLHALVTNTGGPPTGLLADHSEAAWQQAGENLLMSVIRAINAFRSVLVEGSVITVISSIAAKEPNTQLILSNTYRAGLLGLVKTLSQELGPAGIRINGVLPGYTATERLNQLLKTKVLHTEQTLEEKKAEVAQSIPLRRLAEPHEIANVVAFLSSPLASYVTGNNIQVDGGRYGGIL